MDPTLDRVAFKQADFVYDLASQLRQVDRSSVVGDVDIQTLYDWDQAGRLTGITHVDPSIVGAGSWGGHADTSENGILAAYRLDYDSANRLEAFDSFADDLRVRYSYDARDQLTGQTYLAGDATVAAGSDVAHTLLGSSNQSLSYDDNGNRENSPGVSQSGDELNNEIASDGTYSYLYDGEGNITKRTVTATGDYREFDWDYRNRLTGVRDYTSAGALVREVENHYDLNNRWIAQRVDNNANGSFDDVGDRLRQFVQDGSQIALEFEGGQLTGRYLWAMGVDQLLAEEDVPNNSFVSGDIRWALADHLGSVRDLAATDSTIVDHAIYDAFGNTIDNPSDGGEAAIDSLFGYTARPMDEETGLQNNLNRWYDSQSGRWISQDPIGFNAGDANLYRYVGNQPTNASDPSGLQQIIPIPLGQNPPVEQVEYDPYNIKLPLKPPPPLKPTFSILPEPDVFGNYPRVAVDVLSSPNPPHGLVQIAINLDSYSKIPGSGSYGLPECLAPEFAEKYNIASGFRSIAVPHAAGPNDPRWQAAIDYIDNLTPGTVITLLVFNGHGSSGNYGPMSSLSLANQNSQSYKLLMALRGKKVKDIRFRACNITETPVGRTFIQDVASISGASVSRADGRCHPPTVDTGFRFGRILTSTCLGRRCDAATETLGTV